MFQQLTDTLSKVEDCFVYFLSSFNHILLTVCSAIDNADLICLNFRVSTILALSASSPKSYFMTTQPIYD